jgi:hypothetical protein
MSVAEQDQVLTAERKLLLHILDTDGGFDKAVVGHWHRNVLRQRFDAHLSKEEPF